MASNLLDDLQSQLKHQEQLGLKRQRRVVDDPCQPVTSVNNQAVLAFCSNDYLGLANHQQLVSALQQGAAQYGVGAGASHLVSGHYRAHQQVEDTLTHLFKPFIPVADTLLFSSGYAANLAVIS